MARRMQVKQVVVSAEGAGARLRNFLAHEFRDVLLVRSDITSALRKKEVRVNGEITLDSHSLQEGDVVRVEVDVLEVSRRRLQALEVSMRYSEPGLVVLFKPPGVTRPDLEWAAPALLATAGESDGKGDVDLEPWMVVNEIEKGSQGLVVLVKNQMMHGAFLQQIRNGGVAFRFCAVCHGKVGQKAAAASLSAKYLASKVKSLAVSGKANGARESVPNGSDDGTCIEAPDADLFDQWLLYNNLPADIFDHVHIHSSSATRSSGAGHLSMIQATVGRAAHGGLVLRRFMHEVGHPVVGGQKYAQPLANHRDKGNLLALIGVEFASTADPAQKVCISTAAPSKLASVCEREAKFYERRQKKALEEMDRLSRCQTPSENASVVSTISVASDTRGSSEGLVDGKPVAYIAGLKEFCGHTFRVSTDTLIPRPSTETLVDVAVRFLNRVGNKTHQPPRVMDLGTGSGCILLSVLLEIPKARGVGIDISQPALDIAEANCKLHGLNERATMLRGSFESFTSDAAVLANGPFDFIACNPPYISTTKATRMANTVGHEPSLALVAEDGGYQAYRDIHSSLSANLSVLGQAGCIGFEIGKGMERGVRNIFKDWVEAGSFADDHGFLRVLVFQKPPSL